MIRNLLHDSVMSAMVAYMESAGYSEDEAVDLYAVYNIEKIDNLTKAVYNLVSHGETEFSDEHRDE